VLLNGGTIVPFIGGFATLVTANNGTVHFFADGTFT
jgi:hypothetical protein